MQFFIKFNIIKRLDICGSKSLLFYVITQTLIQRVLCTYILLCTFSKETFIFCTSLNQEYVYDNVVNCIDKNR